jgi:hypothetical protein
MWGEAGPPPDLATRLFTERIMYLVSLAPRGACMAPAGHARGGLLSSVQGKV